MALNSTCRRQLIVAAIILFSIVVTLSETRADDISLHGFLQGNYSADLTNSNPDSGKFKLVEERLQLKFEASKDPLHVFIKVDAYYDHIDRYFEEELREGYIDLTASGWDLRAGRQVATWGLGDMVFINDVFPKDYNAYFSGRPIEYMKRAVDSVKIGVYPGGISFEGIVIPSFTPDKLPAPQRFWGYDPMPSITSRDTEKPSISIGNTEFALRAYGNLGGFDTAIYFYHGFYRSPSMMPDDMMQPSKLTLFYPKLNEYGASTQGQALDGVLSLEAGYYDSRNNRDGTNSFVPNSQTRFLVGYQRQLMEDFTAGVQYYGEYMLDYSAYVNNLPSGYPQEKRWHDFTSLRLSQLFINQTL
ncbi:MAG: hypothetical protein HQK97_04795, partial [Nitrospirae bacterium]|nr:hypothetical protein [Nitrospirota bacterium]